MDDVAAGAKKLEARVRVLMFFCCAVENWIWRIVFEFREDLGGFLLVKIWGGSKFVT